MNFNISREDVGKGFAVIAVMIAVMIAVIVVVIVVLGNMTHFRK